MDVAVEKADIPLACLWQEIDTTKIIRVVVFISSSYFKKIAGALFPKAFKTYLETFLSRKLLHTSLYRIVYWEAEHFVD